MFTLKDWLEIVNYKICEGQDFGWSLFDNAYTLDYWARDQNGVSSTVTFSNVTQEVYYVEVFDYSKNYAIRLFNKPNYKEAFIAYGKARNMPDIAFEDDDGEAITFNDFNDADLFKDLARSIINGDKVENVSQQVKELLELNLTKDEIYELMLLAHKEDITLNQYVEKILINAMKS